MQKDEQELYSFLKRLIWSLAYFFVVLSDLGSFVLTFITGVYVTSTEAFMFLSCAMLVIVLFISTMGHYERKFQKERRKEDRN